MEDVYESLSTGKFSDLLVKHQGSQTWKAHKIIVCSQSPLFESMIVTKDNQSILDLAPYDPVAVPLLMEFLYTSTYASNPVEPDFDLPLHIRVYVLASELRVAGLQAYAAQCFQHNLNHMVTNLVVFFSSITEIYTQTQPPNLLLREIVASATITELRDLLTDPLVRARFHAVTREVPEFLTDVLTLMMNIVDETVAVQQQAGGELEEERLRAEGVVAAGGVREEGKEEVDGDEVVLCADCGPFEGDHSVTKKCEVCKEEKTLKFK